MCPRLMRNGAKPAADGVFWCVQFRPRLSGIEKVSPTLNKTVGTAMYRADWLVSPGPG